KGSVCPKTRSRNDIIWVPTCFLAVFLGRVPLPCSFGPACDTKRCVSAGGDLTFLTISLWPTNTVARQPIPGGRHSLGRSPRIFAELGRPDGAGAACPAAPGEAACAASGRIAASTFSE